MPFLPAFAVVFAGIVGGNSGHLDRQLKSVLREVVKSRVNVTLSALSPPKGPVVLTCK